MNAAGRRHFFILGLLRTNHNAEFSPAPAAMRRTPPGATQDRDTQTFYPLGRVKDASGNVGAALATTETDAGTNFAPTPDGRLRQSVTFTFHLRNDQTL